LRVAVIRQRRPREPSARRRRRRRLRDPRDGAIDEDYVDRLGHGTAVTAAIREKAPAARVIAIKCSGTRSQPTFVTLARAIDEASRTGQRSST